MLSISSQRAANDVWLFGEDGGGLIFARCVQVQGVVTRGVVSQDTDDAGKSEGNRVCGHEAGAYHRVAVTNGCSRQQTPSAS